MHPAQMDRSLLSDVNRLSERVYAIYLEAILNYHVLDSPDVPDGNPYSGQKVEHLFYRKCWIDTVQWHMEDRIRAQDIDASDALGLKRLIDLHNQARTDIVEMIDSLIMQEFRNVEVVSGARVNTESPAWALDRLSILALKIHHMNVEVERRSAGDEDAGSCSMKLQVLHEQRLALCTSINELMEDISRGVKFMKVYRQMKMYNDLALNPVLYSAGRQVAGDTLPLNRHKR